MEALEALPAIARLSKTVTRILGQNPGKFQLQGTNTYLVGERNPYVLIDTGEGKEEYIPYLKQALLDSPIHDAKQPYVSDIILTHRHHDHVCGLPSVLALLRKLWDDEHLAPTPPYRPPRIHKFPLSSPDPSLQSTFDSLETGTFLPSPSGAPAHNLADGDAIPVTTGPEETEPESSLRVLHTAGHTPDSICIYYPIDRALFTGDTVLGQGTTVFEDLGSYMASLRKMIDFAQGGDGGQTYDTVYPGHGPVVQEGLPRIKMYLQHREERETQILNVLGQSPPSDAPEGWTTEAIVANIYAKYPRELWAPAAHSTELALNKLVDEGRVKKVGNAWVLSS
ncbi:Metallo-hydrolase/oxidoreductase [Trametes coccinea BRFM310]|uniref:Metallo-hydrolase/oxidoreductase n=1 Tax=Trametes coccinea (strain BRFM310) TaxID=1353009 RepID=A0A1Y2IN22_TRAC3|nr:Metallo-hydrolase/oxidoreductase [Trametes coccinea BRFM310]